MTLRAGDWVEVRSKEEILVTLDKQGRLEGMPFMPQMLEHCGKRFQVYRRAHKTCDTVSGRVNRHLGRKLPDGIHLNLRCDGKAYGGCQAACLIFWKEQWLKPAEDSGAAALCKEVNATNGGCTEEDVRRATRAPGKPGDEMVYSCQATRLLEYTRPLPWWDFRQYLDDYSSGNASFWRIACGLLWSAYYNVTLARSSKLGGPARYLYDRFQALWGGIPYPRRRGELPEGERAPVAALNLRPGDLVRIKSFEEIRKTLTRDNRNRGMAFDAELVPFCGGTYRVRNQVDRFINEKTGRMDSLKTPAVILEDVFCGSRYSECRMFCPRSIYSWWREVWLERVVEDTQNANRRPLDDGLHAAPVCTQVANQPDRVHWQYSPTVKAKPQSAHESGKEASR